MDRCNAVKQPVKPFESRFSKTESENNERVRVRTQSNHAFLSNSQLKAKGVFLETVFQSSVQLKRVPTNRSEERPFLKNKLC